MGSVIDQDRNDRAAFGHAFRSSAIFYKSAGVATTITVSNCWDFKNAVEIGLMVSVRAMSGALVSRTVLSFEAGNVVNFDVDEIDEGSVEVEAFGNRNLRIPYAAVMAVYECAHAVLMVHSYGRNHSLIELEDGNSLTQGRESCWTISPGVRNRAVFHNGHVPVAAQTATLTLTNHAGEDRVWEAQLASMAAYERIVFDLATLTPGFEAHLGGQVGWATVHFTNHSAFTRLLLLWDRPEAGDLQVTHSNFDYTAHQTNMIAAEKPAFMEVPQVAGDGAIVVYPKFSKGKCRVHEGAQEHPLTTGATLPTGSGTFAFAREDGDLPSRIVTGVIGPQQGATLPFECSLGVVHEKCPPKRFHWATVSARLDSTLHLTAYPEIYGTPEGPVELVCKLYSAQIRKVQERVLRYESLDARPGALALSDIFDNSRALLVDALGYVSIFCARGGLMLFSSLSKEGSMTLEPSF